MINKLKKIMLKIDKLINKTSQFMVDHKKISISLIIIISIIIIAIIIPSFINYALSWEIKTHDSNDGEWLSFWGSFLGGIIGGIATLVGVLYTLKQENKAKLQEQIPVLIPADVIYKVLTSSTHNSYIFTSYSKYTDKNTLDQNINIKIINASQGHAFNCKLEFITPSLDYFNKLKDIPENSEEYYLLLSQCNRTYTINHIPIVTSSSNGNITNIPLGSNFQSFFISIFNSIIKENKCKDIYIGKIKLTYDDLLITKETIIKTFDMCICNESSTPTTLKTPEDTFNKSYVINLKFKSIN